MRKDRRMMVICFTVMSVWIFLFAGLNAQAALFLDPYPATSLIGIGNELDPSKLSIDGKDYQTHQDSPEIVNWLSIPEQSGHPFHAKADSDSIPFRTPIPFESGQ